MDDLISMLPDDLISMLPDELLGRILSFLTYKEAIATGILSSRWRRLWTFTSKLDFDGLESICKVPFREGSLLDEHRRQFVEWVNRLIELHEAPIIEEFRVFFDLDMAHQRDIDRWVKYALSRKVRMLELDLPIDDFYGYHYPFPDEILQVNQNFPLDFSCLQKIVMRDVNVDHVALEFFLRNCPLLENLCVEGSRLIRTLTVTRPYPSFKRLEITSCPNLDIVRICDANIVYLKYWGRRRVTFHLENVPFLVELFLGGPLTLQLEDVRVWFSNYLPQLETFKIDIYDTLSRMESENFYEAVNEMGNLKQLTVQIFLDSDSLQSLTNVIRAHPRLRKFVLQPHGIHETVERTFKRIARTYTCLEEVEFLGYRDSQYEVEFRVHFLQNAVGVTEKVYTQP